jgi:phosphoribosylaminoimidazolecarboxamide formyltransferase/IMP cyclohydrolase
VTTCGSLRSRLPDRPHLGFGGIIAFNRELDGETAAAIVARQFVEVIIAPSISQAPARRSPPSRTCACWSAASGLPQRRLDFKRVNGGLLVQERDRHGDARGSEGGQPASAHRAELKTCCSLEGRQVRQSNAIVYAKNGQTIGVGAGQMSRVYSPRSPASRPRTPG